MNRLSDEWFTSKSEKVPLWHKIALSIDEMYVYTGIGRETIRELTKQPEAKQFTLKIGKRTLIKRKQFEGGSASSLSTSMFRLSSRS